MIETIEATVKIENDRRLILQLPPQIIPGLHRVTLVIETETQPEKARHQFVDFPVINVSYWPANISLRREDLYDEPDL